MTNTPPTRFIAVVLTIAIIVILVVASRLDSPCGWNDRVVNVYECIVAMKVPS